MPSTHRLQDAPHADTADGTGTDRNDGSIFALLTWKKPRGCCFHQLAYYWTNNIPTIQIHLCYKIDKISDYTSGLKNWKPQVTCSLSVGSSTAWQTPACRCGDITSRCSVGSQQKMDIYSDVILLRNCILFLNMGLSIRFSFRCLFENHLRRTQSIWNSVEIFKVCCLSVFLIFSV